MNALMDRLPSEARTEDTATRLHRLLDEGLLDGLRDEDGQPASIVATRTLLDLGHPHALLVAPERLDALRRWEWQALPVPSLALTAVLFAGVFFQLAFYTMGYVPQMPYFGSLDIIPGHEPTPRLEALHWFRYEGPLYLFFGILLANTVAWLAAVVVGRYRKPRPWVRRGFLASAALASVLGVLQYLAGYPGAGWGALASAVGALVSWRMLRPPSP